MKKIFLAVFLIFSFFSFTNPVNLFSEEKKTEEQEKKDDLPQSLKDLRRFEIISLGAMPFITLDVNLAYGAGRSIFTGAPFDPFNSSSYTQQEQIGIILTSLGISTAIGIADFIINLVERKKAEKQAEKVVGSYINVIPISEDKEAIQLNKPITENSQSKTEE